MNPSANAVRLVLFFLFVSSPICARQLREQAAQLVIDGNLSDAFWESVPPNALQPGEDGVPAEMGGAIRFGACGAHFCVAAQLPEPNGRVLARSIGRNPEWERDDPLSPPVEDRVRFGFHYKAGGVARGLSVEVNPWGAHRAERDGQLVRDAGFPVAATVGLKGWTVELALPLQALGESLSELHLQAVRIRSRRALAPEFRWFWPDASTGARIALPSTAPGAGVSVNFAPPLLGNGDPPLEIGRVAKVPRMPDHLDPSSPSWDDPAWKDAPAFRLPRNEPYPRSPRYPTDVKWVHDGSTLTLLVRVNEPEPVVAERGGRDADLSGDDHLRFYLATSGSRFLEIMINSVGAIRDSIGGGLHTLRRPSPAWNSGIKVQTRIENGAWIARIDIPLQQCAEALAETEIPAQWRMLLARYRAPRPGEPAEVSALPPVASETFFGPLRYRRVTLSAKSPSQVASKNLESETAAALAGELSALDSRVWSPLYRRHRAVRNMVRTHQRERAERAILAERAAWEEIRTREDWERFRAERLPRLREAAGSFPDKRPSLNVRVSARHEGEGYRLENVVYQSRPGFYVSANLYLPVNPTGPTPAIVIMHSFHYPKTQGELQDMGQLWARAGCAVLIPERLGFGERVETTPWYRQAYASRATFRKQLNPIGETFIGWMAWDLIRGVDLLYERPGIDRKRIILIGAVAGGNEPAAVAAAIDDRIAAIVPFNYDHGHFRLDADFPGEFNKQINMSFVTASVAPRRYVRAFEFGWEGAGTIDYPDLWVSAWGRSLKVWGFYNALDNLATIQGFGLIRLSMERVSHCWSVGPVQRKELHPILQRWFGIPIPEHSFEILPDSQSSVNPYREEARRREGERRRPHEDLLSIPPSLSARLPRKPLHEVAYALAAERLQAARRSRASLDLKERRLRLRRELKSKLGDIEPVPSATSDSFWKKSLNGVEVEAIGLTVEAGIEVPMLLIRPVGSAPSPVVVGITKGGKDRFLTGRAGEIAELLGAGIAVCLPDLRGTGETAPEPDWYNQGDGLMDLEIALGNTLVGARLKDLRTVFAYLRNRPEIDRRRIAVWGDSFAPPNPAELFVDELEYEAGPQVQRHSEPLGATLALLAALYEDDVAAVAPRGGLTGYLSLLEDPFVYTPMDANVPGILEVTDVADIAAWLIAQLR